MFAEKEAVMKMWQVKNEKNNSEIESVKKMRQDEGKKKLNKM